MAGEVAADAEDEAALPPLPHPAARRRSSPARRAVRNADAVPNNNDELAAANGNGVFAGGATVGFLVSNLEVIGPYNQVTGPSAESRKRSSSARRRRRPARSSIVTTLAGRVYRRPATRQEVDQLTGIVAMVQKQGDSFREGLCLAIAAHAHLPQFPVPHRTRPESGDRGWQPAR